MPNVILTDDSFTDVALDQSISGRNPPVQPVATPWYLHPNSSGVVGGGNGDVKFATSGTAKIHTPATNKAVQIELRAVDANEEYAIFLRDTRNTGFIEYGYALIVSPKGSPSYFGVYVIVDWNWSRVLEVPNDVPWTFHPSFNVIAFEAIDTNFRVIINGVVALSFTNSTRPFSSSATKDGFYVVNRVNGNGRVERYTVYDSIELATASEYPIVYFG
jgi:hypothetical protein